MLTNLNKGPVLTEAAGSGWGLASSTLGTILSRTLSNRGAAIFIFILQTRRRLLDFQELRELAVAHNHY